jgi:hypothetical protein
MVKSIFKKQATKNQINWMVALAVIVAASLLFWVWYNQSYLKPANVFWGTISNNLSVNYVTRTSSKEEGTQKLTQVNDLQFTPKLIARSTVKLEDTATNEKVITETIGTATTDYLRYVEIVSKNSANADTSAIGTWAKREAGKGGQPQILADSLLGSVLMFGDLSSKQQSQIISQLKSTNAFQKYDLIAKRTVGGRTIYTYNVSINLDAYSKIYANYLIMLGQDKLAAQIGQQQSGALYDITLDINAGSRVPTKLSVSGNQDTEVFTNVGSGPRFVSPQATLTIAELQTKLSGK